MGQDLPDTPPVIDAIGGRGHGGHAFAMVGYNADGFIIQNSWGGELGVIAALRSLTYADWVQERHGRVGRRDGRAGW